MLASSLALLLAAGATPAAAGAEILARVDDVAITRADYDERVRALSAARAAPLAPSQAVRDLVDEAVLAAEARRQGLERDPAVIVARDQQLRRLAVEAYVTSLGDSAQPTDAALRELYHSTSDAVRLVLVRVTSEGEARQIVERVRKGGDLAAEARRGVDPQLAERGGDTGWVVRAGADPKLMEAAFAAKPGELVGPLQLQLGWAVARVAERRVGDEAGFVARRESLLAYARKEHGENARKHVVAQLKARSRVTLDEAFLKSLGSRGNVSPEELQRVIATVNGKPVRYADVHPSVARLVAAVPHGAGASVRIEFAWREIETRLLEDEALAQGFGRGPAVVATVASIERNLLARALAERIGKTADLADPAVAARLKELRARARITVERERVAALQR